MSRILHHACPKNSNFRNVGRVKSYIQAVRCQIVPYSRRLIYFFYSHENPPVCHTCFWYLQIFSCVFPWLNFEYWITCQLCWFRCKSATVYVLLLQRFCGLAFLLTLLKFSLTEFLWAFFRCKSHREKSRQKMFPQTQSKISVHNKVFQGKMQF